MLPTPDPNPSQDYGLSQREIAEFLGIGRARVFYHEQEALKKMRRALENAGILNPGDFETVAFSRQGRGALFNKPESEKSVQPLFSSLHGWLKVHGIVSLNDGSIVVEDVVRAFRFLKQRYETVVRPPVIIKSEIATPYIIQATAEVGNSMMVRCWPIKHSPRTVTRLETRRCTAIVESEFGTDNDGDFDIPILVCVILS